MKNILKKIIPKQYHWKLYNKVHDHIIGWRSPFYSCFGEDTIVNCILEGKKNGFFVDIGAFHPEKYSNTQFFYSKRGWRGINIEPNPVNIKFFKKRRRRDINLNMGVSTAQAKLDYYYFADGLYNTFSQKMKEECEEAGHICQGVKQIEVFPLVEILDTYLPKGQQIDLLDVDVEEFDLEVLKSNDWTKYRPTIVLVEDHRFSFEDSTPSPIYQFLKEQNYKLVSVCNYSLIFKDRSI